MSVGFERAREFFLQGLAHYEAGRFDAAEASFEASLALVPARASTLLNLGATRVCQGRFEAALAPLEAALAIEPDDLQALSHRGVALAALGRTEEALACHARVLARDPSRLANRLARADLCNALRRPAEALADFDAVLAVDPGHALAWCGRGEALQRLDAPVDALAAYEQALARAPGLANAWSRRGGLLRDLGRLDEAAVCFEQALALGADPELHGFFLAAVTGRRTPATAPPGYVAPLFDNYADSFDAHLLGELGYRAHLLVAEQVRALGAARFESALDLGCGTGLCGSLLRPLVERLVGVDLSAAMLGKARVLGVYDELVQAELTAHLATTPAVHDLLVAADTLIYVGDLGEVLAGAARVTRPGAVFCASLECVADERTDVVLLPSLRYAHSERHVRERAAAAGWQVAGLVRQPIRHEQRQPIDGLCVTLRRSEVPEQGAPGRAPG